MASLTVLVLTDIECSWCHKIICKRFFDSSDPGKQMMIKKEGRLISHGICPTCMKKEIAEAVASRRKTLDSCLRGNDDLGHISDGLAYI